jgi:hypothetical protein
MRDLGELVRPLLTVFAEQVGPGEVVSLKTLALVVAVRGPVALGVELGKRGVGSGQVLKPVPAVGDRRVAGGRADAVDPVRPEQPPCGIDQPPLPLVLLGAKVARCLQLRPGLVAAVSIPVFGAGVVGQVRRLFSETPAEILDGFRLARPVLVDELPEAVDQGEEIRRVHAEPLGSGAAGADVVDLERVDLGRAAHEDKQLVDVGGVDAAFLGHSAREAAHAKQLFGQLRRQRALECQLEGLLRFWLQADRL